MAVSAYITPTDVFTRNPKQVKGMLDRAESDSTATTVADTKLVAAVLDANGVCDSYIGQLYTVPLTTIPQCVVPHATAIAVWLLMQDRNDMGGAEAEQSRYDAAIAFLESVAKGTLSLGLPAASITDVSGAPEVTQIATGLDPDDDDWSSPTRAFGDEEIFTQW